MLVVVAIFIVVSVAITATSVNLTRLHRRTANAERLGEDLRFSLELLVRLARNRRIVYPALPATLPVKSSSLTLVDANGSSIAVQTFPRTDAACAGLNAACLAVNVPAYGWTAITGKNVNVTKFDVYVTPQADPFQLSGGAYANNLQPRVTFVVDASYMTTSTKEAASLGVQTTVSSRVYVR
jgi:hypothetical protein